MADKPQVWAGPPYNPDEMVDAPGVFAGPDADGAPPALGPIAMGGGAPVFAAPDLPAVTKTPSPLQNQITQTDQKLRHFQQMDATPYGSPTNHPGLGGKILHALSVAGNIAGDIFAPGQMALIPGTQLNRRDQESQLSERLQGLTSANDEDQKSQAETAYTQQRPAIETAKNGRIQGIADAKNKTTLAKAGLTLDEDGNPVADESSPAFQSRQIHDDVEQSKESLNEAEEAVKRASIDPNSPAYKLAVSKANTARVNAGAAVQRAQAYYGNYLQHAYNKGLDGTVLPGAPEIVGDDGQTVTPGSTNAAQAVKANAGAAQFNDVHGSLDQLEAAAKALHDDGDSFNSPAVSTALQHVHGVGQEFLQSLDKAGLSDAQRNYVIALNAAHERIQGMRKSAGGGATDSQVANLLSMLPNGSTPDLKYFMGQTKQIRSTADLIGKGAATAHGGLSVRGQHAPSNGGDKVGGNAGGGHKIQVGDKTYTYNGSGATDDMKNYTLVPK